MVIGIGLLVAAQPRCAALSSSLTHTRYGKVARQWHVALVVSHTDTGRGKAMEMVQDQTFTATDGATIGYQTLGTGPSLILVPGVLSRACDYRAFAKALAGSFTVHTIERRGRGRSSPQNSDYCIETERLDVCALQKITQSRYIFGHSFGGLIALEAARNNASLIRAAVYEPGISVDGSISLTWSAEYKRLLTQGKRLDAFVEFSRAAGPAQARKIPRRLMKLLLPLFMKRSDLQQKLELLDSNLREHEQIARSDNTYKKYAEVSAKTLLLFGGKSGLTWVSPAIEKLATVLPSVEKKGFPRLNHFGPDQTGPGEVAQAVKEFFLA